MDETKAGPAVVTHGGAGNDKQNEDGCRAAAEAAMRSLAVGGSALDAAVAAVVRLEDDGRFNAGRGADLRLDGETIECDASVMDSEGALGAVAAVRDVKNPARLARAVADTPHVLVAGEGADRLARALGLPPAEFDRAAALAKYRATVAALSGPEPVLPGADNAVFRKLWNFPLDWDEAMRRHGCGTVGAVVRDARGRFAVVTSTGGSAPALLGRIGDTPLVGAGFFCGPLGAVGATGIGEAIVRRLLARTVYGWIEAGWPLQDALDAGIALFADDIPVGLIGVTATEAASASNRPMPVAHGQGERR